MTTDQDKLSEFLGRFGKASAKTWRGAATGRPQRLRAGDAALRGPYLGAVEVVTITVRPMG
jgi:hypothetical protein